MTIESIESHEVRSTLHDLGIDVLRFTDLFARAPDYLYKVYQIRQGKRGKIRTIEEPIEELMEMQRKMIPYFEQFPLHPACMAVKGKGIGHNAARHEHAKYVLRVDISKCYPSVKFRHISSALQVWAIDSRDQDTLDYRHSLYRIGSFLARLCTYPHTTEGCLPTGAPTSPILCNIALTEIDHQVQEICDKHGYTYTRYIDDLHLSTTGDQRHWVLIDEVGDILQKHGFDVNKKKSKWYTLGTNDKVIITGVRITDGCKVPREFKRTVRARLQNLAKDGQEIDAETRGCLAYIQSIDPERHQSLLDYYQRRLKYVPDNGKCASLEQNIPGCTSIHS